MTLCHYFHYLIINTFFSIIFHTRTRRNLTYTPSHWKELFFKEETDDLKLYCLCGTSGKPFHIEVKDNWNIYEFMKDHGYQPSKFKLSVMLKSSEVSDIQ